MVSCWSLGILSFQRRQCISYATVYSNKRWEVEKSTAPEVHGSTRGRTDHLIECVSLQFYAFAVILLFENGINRIQTIWKNSGLILASGTPGCRCSDNSYEVTPLFSPHLCLSGHLPSVLELNSQSDCPHKAAKRASSRLLFYPRNNPGTKTHMLYTSIFSMRS